MIAKIISRISDPFILFGLLIYLISDGNLMLLTLMIGIPLMLFLLALKIKAVSNWDVSDRKERPKILWVLLGIEIIISLMLKTTVFVPFFVLFFGYIIITHFWKISGHAMTAAATSGYIILLYGWTWWPILLFVPIVCWSRVVTKNHTIMQVIAGALYSWGIIYLFA